MSQSQLPLWLQYIQVLAVLAVPFLAFFGGFVGAVVTDGRERRKQRNDFIERQLSELYGSLLSLRKHVTARHEFIGRSIPQFSERQIKEVLNCVGSVSAMNRFQRPHSRI